MTRPLRSAKKELRRAEKRAAKAEFKPVPAVPNNGDAKIARLAVVQAPRGLTMQTVANAAGPKRKAAAQPFEIPSPPPGVLPDGVTAKGIAMDSGCLTPSGAYSPILDPANFFSEGVAWFGFQALAALSQRAEYRKISETIAKEMTRKFITISATGDKDKTDRVSDMNKALKRWDVASLFRKLALHDGQMGRAHLYIDLGDAPDPNELETPLTTKNNSKIRKGSLKGLRAVEPMWCYPASYEAIDPLHKNFYRPDLWYVNRRRVHRTRLIPMIGREVPDLLKPAYSFGGLSLTQMAKPYVDNWLRTRQSVSDITHSFSVSGIKTSLASSLMGGADGNDIFARAELFNQVRDNRGVFILDKDTEDFFQTATPLGGLDKLQAQAQEQICSVATIPLVKYTGITPSGLNASSDGEIRVFYDDINAQQEHFYGDPLDTVFKVIQLDLWGEVDEDIVWSFEPLWQLDDAAKATIRKTDADTANSYITSGVLSPLEERQRLADADGSPYASLDVEDLPDPPAAPPGDDPNGDPSGGGGGSDPATGHQEMDAASSGPKMAGDAAMFMRKRMAKDDANWEEGKHPRADNGQFGSGGGGSSPHIEKKNSMLANAKGPARGYAIKVIAQIDEALNSDDPVSALRKLKIKKQASGGHKPFQTLIDALANDLGESKGKGEVKIDPKTQEIVEKIGEKLAESKAKKEKAEQPKKVRKLSPEKQYELDRKKRIINQLKIDKTGLSEGLHKEHFKLSKMTDADFQKESGIKMVASSDISKENPFFATQMRKAVAEVPVEHRAILKQSEGFEVKVTKTVKIEGTSTTGLTGSEGVGGFYNPADNSVNVPERVMIGGVFRGIAGQDRVMHHEIGHAISNTIGHRRKLANLARLTENNFETSDPWYKPSGDKAFIASIPPPGKRSDPGHFDASRQESLGRYYHLNTEETWAECYSVMVSNNPESIHFGGIKRDVAAKIYAKPIAIIKKQIEEAAKYGE